MATVTGIQSKTPSVFNGPVEFGIRSALILVAAYPRALDLQRLLVLDYVIVHSGDLAGGPESLHAPSPMRAGEISLRRGLVEQGLQLLASRGLVKRTLDHNGILYQAEDLTNLYISSMRGNYFEALKIRSLWAVSLTEPMNDEAINRLRQQSTSAWKMEFVDLEDAQESAL